jgi:hypothetical protein
LVAVRTALAACRSGSPWAGALGPASTSRNCSGSNWRRIVPGRDREYPIADACQSDEGEPLIPNDRQERLGRHHDNQSQRGHGQAAASRSSLTITPVRSSQPEHGWPIVPNSKGFRPVRSCSSTVTDTRICGTMCPVAGTGGADRSSVVTYPLGPVRALRTARRAEGNGASPMSTRANHSYFSPVLAGVATIFLGWASFVCADDVTPPVKADNHRALRRSGRFNSDHWSTLGTTRTQISNASLYRE